MSRKRPKRHNDVGYSNRPPDESESGEYSEEDNRQHTSADVNRRQTRSQAKILAKKRKKIDEQKAKSPPNPLKQTVAHEKVPTNVKIQVPIANYYSGLENNDEEVRIRRVTNSSNSKKKKIPPIVVPPPSKKSDIVAALTLLQIKEFRVKLTSVGHYIFVENPEDHKKIREKFSETHTPYYSHDLPEDRVAKVVLKGLDLMEVKVIELELKELGFPPVDIKIITPKQTKYVGHVNYLIYFKRDSTNLKNVYQTKSINHTIVHWEPFRPSRNSITQCRRCQRYGHGTKHCQMPERCVYCSKSHDSSKCPDLATAYEAAKTKANESLMDYEQNQAKEPDVVNLDAVKCCNCNGNHLASSPDCPEKEKYRKLQQNLALRNQKRSNQRNRQFSNADFPLIRNNSATLSHRQGPDRITPSKNGPLFSQVLQAPMINPTYTTNGPGNVDSEQLFSLQEINSLLNEMLTDLSRCRSKAEQFQVITNLALKYVYNG